MTCFHGTTKDTWEKIQQEGILFGRRYVLNNDGTIHHEVERCTYLAIDKEEAEYYGEVVLQVEYEPNSSKYNNYKEGCWQFRVYEPIALDKIKVVKNEKRYGLR